MGIIKLLLWSTTVASFNKSSPRCLLTNMTESPSPPPLVVTISCFWQLFRRKSLGMFFLVLCKCLALCSLADKSSDMFDCCGNTSSNWTGAWSCHTLVQLFLIIQQYHAFSKPPCTSPINASVAKNVNNIIRSVRHCKSTIYLIIQTMSNVAPVIHIELQQATALPQSSAPSHGHTYIQQLESLM